MAFSLLRFGRASFSAAFERSTAVTGVVASNVSNPVETPIKVINKSQLFIINQCIKVFIKHRNFKTPLWSTVYRYTNVFNLIINFIPTVYLGTYTNLLQATQGLCINNVLYLKFEKPLSRIYFCFDHAILHYDWK